MPTLWLCQDEWGYLKKGVPEWVSARLDVPLSRVYEVITFYTMYYTENPGKYNLQVCRSISCHMAGSPEIVAYLEEKLGIRAGETDGEGLFRIEEVECLGACGYGPMMQVGKGFHEHLTKEMLDELIEEWNERG
jgi:NADH-quinone oxidoreductase subunit E